MVGSTPYLSCKAAQIASRAETRRSFRSLQGCGFPAKEMRKAVAGSAGDQPNAMLALSAEERIFLSVLTEVAHIRGYNRSDSQCSIVLLMEYFRVII